MKNSPYIFIIPHFSILAGGLLLENLIYFFISAALVGLFPRRRNHFFYFWLLSLAALALALYLKPPVEGVQESLAGVLPLGPVPFWAAVVLVSSLAQSLTSMAFNGLFSKRRKKRKIGAYLRR